LNNLASYLADSDPRASLRAARDGLQLAERLGVRSFNLRSNAFSAAFHAGDWDWAIALTEADVADAPAPLMRAAAIADLVQALALRGEPIDERLAEVEDLASRLEGDIAASPVAWGRAWSALAAGRDRDAHDAFRRNGELFPMSRLESLLEAAHAALWAGDVGLAEEELAESESDSRRGRVVDTARLGVRAGLAASEGRTREALVMYRDVLRSWRDLGLAFDEALTGLDMAMFLDPTDAEVRAAADAARAILEGLGARPLLDRLDAALARRAVVDAGAPTTTARSAKGLGAPTG
jgi:hypothetical protein